MQCHVERTVQSDKSQINSSQDISVKRLHRTGRATLRSESERGETMRDSIECSNSACHTAIALLVSQPLLICLSGHLSLLEALVVKSRWSDHYVHQSQHGKCTTQCTPTSGAVTLCSDQHRTLWTLCMAEPSRILGGLSGLSVYRTRNIVSVVQSVTPVSITRQTVRCLLVAGRTCAARYDK